MDQLKPPRSHLYLDIKERIREDIERLPPHTRIPSRTAMMERYGVTRTTIEKAISELAGSGYLYSLNGSGTYVSDRSHVKIDQTGSRGKEMRAWGVVLPSITDDLYPEIVRGIEDSAHLHNIQVILCNTDNDAEKQHAYIANLADSGVEGVIVVPAITKEPTLHSFRMLEERGIPFVFCNRSVEGTRAPQVLSNNFYGAFMAVKYMIGLQYRHIAFMASPRYSVAEQRYQGYMAALHEAGMTPRSELAVILDEGDQKKAGYEAAVKLFSQPNRPDAVCCFNDNMAEGLYEAAQVAGIRIGQDLAVVGYGDTRVCDRLAVKLTSVRYRTYEAGKYAAELMLRLLKGEEIGDLSSVVLRPEMSIRESCGETLR